MDKNTVSCNICKSRSAYLDTSIVLEKHYIKYYACSQCGFIQTEEPYWLDEAYSSAIATSDIGLIGRNIKYSRICAALIPFMLKHDRMYLDYGGGNGMFVRMMRDLGFDFFWKDKYATNQFALGFEADANEKFSALTAFEVFEHLPYPILGVEDMFNYSETLIFSTRLIPRQRIMPHEWWYFAPDTGQHISLYSWESLNMIAKKFGVKLSSNGVSLHVLSPQKISSTVLRLLSIPQCASIFSSIVNIRRQPLLEKDYRQLTGRSFIQK